MVTVLPHVTFANDTMNSFLLSAQVDVSNLVSSRFMSFSNNGSNWIDSPEARVSINNDNEMSYSFRARPKFTSERSAEKNLKYLEHERKNVIYDDLFNDGLKDRYNILLDALTQKSEIEYIDQLIKINKIKLQFYQDMAQTNDFSPVKLQETALELYLLKQKHQLHTDRLAYIATSNDLNEMMMFYREMHSWTEGVFTISQIAKSIAIDSALPMPSLNLKGNDLNLRIVREEYNLVTAKNDSFLKHVELKYVDKNNDSQEFTLGFSIPFGSSDSKLEKSLRKINQAKIDHQRRKFKTQKDIQKSRSDIHWIISEYDSNQKSLQQIENALTKQKGISSPLVLLSLKQQKLSYQKISWNNHLKALSRYIDFLHTSDKLISKPLRNWLLKKTPLLKGNI